MKPRLIDIAQRADVSEATVSRVLNGKPGITEETRSAVLEAARDLGRDLTGLPGTRERLVGVLVPDLENPIFAQWAERVEAELFQRGAATLIAVRARTVEREQEAFERFLRAGACGIVVVSGHHAQEEGSVGHYRAIVQQGIPLALVNGVRPDLDATYISTDDDRAVRMSIAHLRELGHTAIALAVGDERTWPVREKVRAFEQALAAESGVRGTVAYTDFSYAGGYQAAREVAAAGCTGLLCGSDVMAAGALEGVRSLGLAVPGDVSVIGYDDAQWAAMTSPALTTVRQSVPEMARAAVRAVLEGGEHSRRPARTELQTIPQLIVRGTTGAAPRGGADARRSGRAREQSGRAGELSGRPGERGGATAGRRGAAEHLVTMSR